MADRQMKSNGWTEPTVGPRQGVRFVGGPLDDAYLQVEQPFPETLTLAPEREDLDASAIYDSDKVMVTTFRISVYKLILGSKRTMQPNLYVLDGEQPQISEAELHRLTQMIRPNVGSIPPSVEEIEDWAEALYLKGIEVGVRLAQMQKDKEKS